MEISKREELIELANRLFIYTDEQQWDKLKSQVFAEKVLFDMSSLGLGEAEKLSASEICEKWRIGFQGIDAIHHQAGNHLVSFKEDGVAEVFCYAVASHYKKSATKGPTREFIGTYNLLAVLTDVGWRINGFRYNVKYVTGNSALE